MELTKTLYVPDRTAWHVWLEEHAATEQEVWLIYYKKCSGKPRISYEDAVEEALCFGWIDSLVQRMDEEKYAQKFTPRKRTSKWSELNKRRIVKLVQEERMTEAGMAKIDFDINEVDITEPAHKKPEPELSLSIQKMLMEDEIGWQNFIKLAPSHRRNYIGWIMDAKKEETQMRRAREALELLLQNKKLGMK
ncbi:MAG: YdeI/OmpD-associated family protein [Anaerolineaceae bacterium]